MSDEFEDDEFDDFIETDAKRTRDEMRGSTVETVEPLSKVIRSNREQQATSRQNRRRLNFEDIGVGRRLDGKKTTTVQQQEEQGQGLLNPGIFNGNNHLDVNVHITKETQPKHEISPPDNKNKKLKYFVSKHIEQNRDLYFVRLVAGALKRPFESIINVEDQQERGADLEGKVTVNVKYSYSNELLYAWSTILEKVKLMINNYGDSGWSSTEEIHYKMVSRDMTCVAFARYVAFIITKELNNLIPRNRTRYVIDDDGSMEDQLTVDLMNSLNVEYDNLKYELANRFL